MSSQAIPQIRELLRKYNTATSSAGFVFYADDGKICVSGKATQHVSEIVDGIQTIFAEMGLVLNKQKTKYLVHRSSYRHALPESTAHISLLGFKYKPFKKILTGFWNDYQDITRSLAYAVSAHIPSLERISPKITGTIVCQCLMSRFMHCMPILVNEDNMMHTIINFWNIESIIMNAIYAHGKLVKRSIPLVYSGLLFMEKLESLAFTLVKDERYKDHSIVKAWFDSDLHNKWYSRNGLKYRPFTHIRVVDTYVDHDVFLEVRSFPKVPELRAFIELRGKRQRWSIKFERPTPAFDIIRVGIFTILKGFAGVLPAQKFLIVTSDQSLRSADGCLELWNVPSVKELSILVSEEPGPAYAEKFRKRWKNEVSIKAADIIGNILVKHTIKNNLTEHIRKYWETLSFSRYIFMECWQMLFNTPSSRWVKIRALRFLFQYLGNPNDYCECKGRGMLHFICECPQSHATRRTRDDLLLDYLARCIAVGKFFPPESTITANKLLIYINDLYRNMEKRTKTASGASCPDPLTPST